MCPKEGSATFNNKEVKERILAHLKEWYEAGDLLHIGKMLHTIQDSFCYSHCWRRVKGDGLGAISVGHWLDDGWLSLARNC
jgi:hypothetical protein